MQHILAILHSDQEYADALMDYINLFSGFLFKVIAFTDHNILMSHVKQHKIQALIFDDSIREEEIKETKIKSCYYLSDVPSDNKFGAYKTIFMYQSVNQIMEKILQYYEEDGNHIFCGKKKDTADMTVVSGVVCLHQQVRYTSLLAEKLAVEEGRVLMISFQPFIETKGKDGVFPLSEVIYAFRMKEEYIEKLPQWISHEKGYDQLSGIEHFSDLSEFTGEECLHFMDEIVKQGEYTHLVLDIPAVSTSVSLFSLADNIYLLVGENEGEKKMLTQMKEHLKKKEGNHIMERIKEVII